MHVFFSRLWSFWSEVTTLLTVLLTLHYIYNFKCNFQIQYTYLKNAQYFSHLPQSFLNFLKVKITL